jgi:hypothetical protein
MTTTAVDHRARPDACTSRPEGAARTQSGQHLAEDGMTGAMVRGVTG